MKVSLSALSLPPVGLFPTEEKQDKCLALKMDDIYNSDEEDHEDNVDYEPMNVEKRHQSLEYLDDFYPIEEHHYFDDPLEEEDTSGIHQMTTTTTIASFRPINSIFPKSQPKMSPYQKHNRASSL
jgi:hypothetical protein